MKTNVEKDDVVITSMACRLPQSCDTPQSLWQFLMNKGNAVTKIPNTRWNVSSAYPPSVKTALFGAFINEVDYFDPAFFHISKGEAEVIDPQQRLCLEVAYEALINTNLHGKDKSLSNSKGVERFYGANIGVYIASTNHDWNFVMGEGNKGESSYAFAGHCDAINAGRISFSLGLTGPSMVCNTGCSSSLVAIDTAKKALLNNECDAALVVGVNLNIHPITYSQLASAGQLSPNGRCAVFDSRADGYVRGEGVVAFVLTRESFAIKTEEQILAHLLSTGANNDGICTSLQAPNGEAQTSLLSDVLQRSATNPNDVSMIEAHGTGTILGDVTEMNAIKKVFFPSSTKLTRESPLILGSLKSNIGHLEPCAGLAGTIKAILCLNNEVVPPNLHFESLNPLIERNENFQVPTGLTPLKSNSKGNFIAGVSSFSMAGTNTFILLEKRKGFSNKHLKDFIPSSSHMRKFSIPWPVQKGFALHQSIIASTEFDSSPILNVDEKVLEILGKVAVNSEGLSLSNNIQDLGIDSLACIEFISLLDKAFLISLADSITPSCFTCTLPTARDVANHIKSILNAKDTVEGKILHLISLISVSKSQVSLTDCLCDLGIDSLGQIELLAKLNKSFSIELVASPELSNGLNIVQAVEALLNAKNMKTEITSPLRTPDIEKGVAFLFTGQGSQYHKMCKELYESESVFKATMNECIKVVDALLPVSLFEVIYGSDSSLINNTLYTQPALFAIEYSLATLWQSKGLYPSVVCGHSVGEIAAATFAGVFSLKDGLKLIVARSKAMSNCDPMDGVMLAIRSDEQTCLDAIKAVKLTEEGKIIDNFVSIAAVNGPKSCVLAGSKAYLDLVVAALEKGVGVSKLKVSHAFHSPLMSAAIPSFESCLKSISISTPSIPMVSNLTGNFVTGHEIKTIQYWVDHLIGCVRFKDGMTKLLEKNVKIFLEIGSQAVLSSMGRQTSLNFYKSNANPPSLTWLISVSKDKSNIETMANAEAKLKEEGAIQNVIVEVSDSSSELDIPDRDELKLKIMDVVQNVLGLSLSPSSFLYDLGLDSLVSLELKAALLSAHSVDVDMKILMDRKVSVNSIIDSLCGVSQIFSCDSSVLCSSSVDNEATLIHEPKFKASVTSSPAVIVEDLHHDALDLVSLSKQLFNPETLMERLENRLLDRLLQTYNSNNSLSFSLPPAPKISSTSTLLSKPSSRKTITSSVFSEGQGLIYLIHGDTSTTKSELVTFIKANLQSIKLEISKRGGLLIRNCGLRDEHDFKEVLELFSNGLKDYKDGISPRTKILEGVYTSTEYPSTYDMALHNEMSYNPVPPSMISFFCQSPPKKGTGQTPIASSLKILNMLPKNIVKEFKDKGVTYVVNSPSASLGPGVSWQSMYDTESKLEVEAICKDLSVVPTWHKDGRLTTTRNASATRVHPTSGQEVWFNHAHLFHPSDLPIKVQSALKTVYSSYHEYPKFVSFGNGEEIPLSYLSEIRNVQDKAKVSWDWEQGDLVLYDNFLISHGRTKFDKDDAHYKRKILASLLF